MGYKYRMLYIIALLLFFILLAIVWGKEGVKLGLMLLLFVICCSASAVMWWIYWPTFVTLYGDGESFWGGFWAIVIITLALYVWERFKNKSL